MFHRNQNVNYWQEVYKEYKELVSVCGNTKYNCALKNP